MEEFPCSLVVFDAERWVKIGVEPPDDVLFIDCELICSVRCGREPCGYHTTSGYTTDHMVGALPLHTTYTIFPFHFSHCPFISTPPSMTSFFGLRYYISRGHCRRLRAQLRIQLYPEIAEPGPVRSNSSNPPLIHMILVITPHWIIQTPNICISPESYGRGECDGDDGQAQ